MSGWTRRRRATPHVWMVCGLLLAVAACSKREQAPPLAPLAAATTEEACTLPADAHLNARLRGALDADIAWTTAQMTCSGGPRPNSEGLRVSIAGDSPQGRLRFIFGMPAAPGQADATAVPTNLTVILEGRQRVFATQGQDRCTTDALHQRTLPPRGFRIEARGFCTDPAAPVGGAAGEVLLVSTFDFVARIQAHEERDSRRTPAPPSILPRSIAAP